MKKQTKKKKKVEYEAAMAGYYVWGVPKQSRLLSLRNLVFVLAFAAIFFYVGWQSYQEVYHADYCFPDVNEVKNYHECE